MPLYMDIHRNVEDVTPDGIELGHLGDVEAQEQYGVRYLRYWVNQEAPEVFCLVDAPHCCASARRR